jgi:predicted GNAT family acetyltransferase
MKPGTKPMSRGKGIKAKTPRNAANAAEKRYMGAVAELGCAVCRHLGYGITPAIVHHQRTGTGKMRASHYRTVPLCPHHHQGSGEGVHDMGREQFAEMHGISEVELVEQTRAILAHLIQGVCND